LEHKYIEVLSLEVLSMQYKKMKKGQAARYDYVTPLWLPIDLSSEDSPSSCSTSLNPTSSTPDDKLSPMRSKQRASQPIRINEHVTKVSGPQHQKARGQDVRVIQKTIHSHFHKKRLETQNDMKKINRMNPQRSENGTTIHTPQHIARNIEQHCP
jgi:hypothetical protein